MVNERAFSLLYKLKTEYGYSQGKIAELAGVDRSTVSKWFSSSGSTKLKPKIITSIAEGLRKEGKRTIASEFLEAVGGAHDKGTRDKGKDMEYLPAALYSKEDIQRIDLCWPGTKEIEFIFAEGKYCDRGIAWDITHKKCSMLNSFLDIKAHDRNMSELETYGITEELFREHAEYFKKMGIPRSFRDLPKKMLEHIAKNRLAKGH